jgi:nitroreductase
MTTVSEFLLNRASEPKLEAPVPDDQTLSRAFACAARTPDHALLRPWRYLVIQDEGLKALGELFASTCPNNSDDRQIAKLRRAPLRAPMVIVGIASPRPHPKVPEVEQVLSAGVGVSFLGLALQEAGYGVMWRTGSPAYHPAVHRGLGLAEGESVVAFLYVGTVVSEKPAVPRPDVSDFVRNWPE